MRLPHKSPECCFIGGPHVQPGFMNWINLIVMKDQQIPFNFIGVLSLSYGHQRVSALYVAFFRMIDLRKLLFPCTRTVIMFSMRWLALPILAFPPPLGAVAPDGPRPPHYGGCTITLKHFTLVVTPLDEWSARHRDLSLTTHNTPKRQTSMTPPGFEPTIPASERPQINALDRASIGIGLAYCPALGLSGLALHNL